MSVDLSGYIDVAERIAEFRTKHPEGSLQPADPAQPFRVLDVGGQTYIAVVAAAYRSPEDQRPGIGMAYEVFPGKTPYTRGSELQNAETSAWGRAIVAALAADTKRGIASADEVRNRNAERESWEQAAKPPTPEQVAEADALTASVIESVSEADLREVWESAKASRAGSLITEAQGAALRREFDARLAELRAEQGDAK